MAIILEILVLTGSLCFFIFGMKMMSDGIQKAAGDGLKSVLKLMTKNKYLGIFSGFIITSIIQSSSATTLMTVSFVNAGILSLVESVGIILGANIGTTFTGWIVSLLGFKLQMSNYIIILFCIAVPLYLSKQERLKNWGVFILGFSFLFLGLEELRQSVPDLNNNVEFMNMLSLYSSSTMVHRLAFVIIGMIITILVQSSSVSMAITLTLASQGLPIDIAAALCLGGNIGTTSTVEIASLVANVQAKRSARVHTWFNIIGVIWMIFAMPYTLDFIRYIGFYHPDEQIAAFHTIFNILNVILLFSFVPQLVYLSKLTVYRKSKTKLIEEASISNKLEFSTPISEHLSAEVALQIAQKKLQHFQEYCIQIMQKTTNLLLSIDPKQSYKLHAEVLQMENNADEFESKIIHYLSQINHDNQSLKTYREVEVLLKIVQEIGRVFNRCANIANNIEKKKEYKAFFTPSMRKNLLSLEKLLQIQIQETIQVSNDFFQFQNKINPKSLSELVKNIKHNHLQISKITRKQNKQILKNIQHSKESTVGSLFYRDILQDIKRISKALNSIAKLTYGTIRN